MSCHPLIPRFSAFAVKICPVLQSGKKMTIIIPFLCFPVSLESWKFEDDSFLFLLTFFILLPFISMRIHMLNLIFLPHSFAFESMVYFSLQDDQFFQALLSLKNNLFCVSSACFSALFLPYCASLFLFLLNFFISFYITHQLDSLG